MSDKHQDQVQGILEPLGGWAPLTSVANIRSDHEPENLAPFSKPGVINWEVKLAAPFTRSNYIPTSKAWKR